jgi:hypothetical protein
MAPAPEPPVLELGWRVLGQSEPESLVLVQPVPERPAQALPQAESRRARPVVELQRLGGQHFSLPLPLESSAG